MRIAIKELHRIKDGVHEIHVVTDEELLQMNTEMQNEGLTKQDVVRRFSRNCEWSKENA